MAEILHNTLALPVGEVRGLTAKVQQQAQRKSYIIYLQIASFPQTERVKSFCLAADHSYLSRARLANNK